MTDISVVFLFSLCPYQLIDLGNQLATYWGKEQMDRMGYPMDSRNLSIEGAIHI